MGQNNLQDRMIHTLDVLQRNLLGSYLAMKILQYGSYSIKNINIIQIRITDTKITNGVVFSINEIYFHIDIVYYLFYVNVFSQSGIFRVGHVFCRKYDV